MTASIVWRRLDVPGHDACRLRQSGAGWMLEGTAVFVENGSSARIDYRVQCDEGWTTTEGHVRGWTGATDVEFAIKRSAQGVWQLNGADVPAVVGCFDLDLGFTPATNLFQLRRVALSEGNAANVPVAWIDTSTDTLELVHQRYERRSETTYWYHSPRFGYEELLEVRPDGFVRLYPNLWEAEE